MLKKGAKAYAQCTYIYKELNVNRQIILVMDRLNVLCN